MIISRKSWHYRFLQTDGPVPDNLCNYFWKLVMNLVGVILGVAILGLGIGFLSAPLWPYVLTDLQPTDLQIIRYITYAEIAFGLFMTFLFFRDKSSLIRLAIEYIKAIKGKYCPKLDFKD